jgi:hypothetical protein
VVPAAGSGPTGIAMLHQADLDVFKDSARLRGDSEFDPIRFDPGFGAVLADIGFPADPFASG